MAVKVPQVPRTNARVQEIGVHLLPIRVRAEPDPGLMGAGACGNQEAHDEVGVDAPAKQGSPALTVPVQQNFVHVGPVLMVREVQRRLHQKASPVRSQLR